MARHRGQGDSRPICPVRKASPISLTKIRAGVTVHPWVIAPLVPVRSDQRESRFRHATGNSFGVSKFGEKPLLVFRRWWNWPAVAAFSALRSRVRTRCNPSPDSPLSPPVDLR